MSIYLRLVLSIIVIAYFIFVIRFLKKQILSLKYTLIWLFMGVVMGLLCIFPELLYLVTGCLGIKSPINGLFLIGIFLAFLISMSLTAIVSGQNDKIRRLAQENAMLEKQLRDLEEQIRYQSK